MFGEWESGREASSRPPRLRAGSPAEEPRRLAPSGSPAQVRGEAGPRSPAPAAHERSSAPRGSRRRRNVRRRIRRNRSRIRRSSARPTEAPTFVREEAGTPAYPSIGPYRDRTDRNRTEDCRATRQGKPRRSLGCTPADSARCERAARGRRIVRKPRSHRMGSPFRSRRIRRRHNRRPSCPAPRRPPSRTVRKHSQPCPRRSPIPAANAVQVCGSCGPQMQASSAEICKKSGGRSQLPPAAETRSRPANSLSSTALAQSRKSGQSE